MGKGKDSKDPDPTRAVLAGNLCAPGAGQGRPQEIKLSLKYPMGDERRRKAVESIRDQLTGESRGLWWSWRSAIRKLKKDVEKTHNYQLAYYHYDYPDDTCNLLPLLGEHGSEGRRQLPGLRERRGVVALAADARACATSRPCARRCKASTKMVNAGDAGDSAVAAGPAAGDAPRRAAVPFDPWLVFTDIEQWKLDRP